MFLIGLQVIVTAESTVDPNNRVSRPLRIEITDIDDNVPDFGQDQVEKLICRT